MAIFREGIPRNDVGHILALDEHVRLADGKGFVVQFLAEHHQLGLGVHALQVRLSYGEHPSCSCGGIIDGADNTRLGESFTVFQEEQVHHEPDDLTRGEMLTSRFVREFRNSGQANI